MFNSVMRPSLDNGRQFINVRKKIQHLTMLESYVQTFRFFSLQLCSYTINIPNTL